MLKVAPWSWIASESSRNLVEEFLRSQAFRRAADALHSPGGLSFVAVESRANSRDQAPERTLDRFLGCGSERSSLGFGEVSGKVIEQKRSPSSLSFEGDEGVIGAYCYGTDPFAWRLPQARELPVYSTMVVQHLVQELPVRRFPHPLELVPFIPAESFQCTDDGFRRDLFAVRSFVGELPRKECVRHCPDVIEVLHKLALGSSGCLPPQFVGFFSPEELLVARFVVPDDALRYRRGEPLEGTARRAVSPSRARKLGIEQQSDRPEGCRAESARQTRATGFNY